VPRTHTQGHSGERGTLAGGAGGQVLSLRKPSSAPRIPPPSPRQTWPNRPALARRVASGSGPRRWVVGSPIRRSKCRESSAATPPRLRPKLPKVRRSQTPSRAKSDTQSGEVRHPVGRSHGRSRGRAKSGRSQTPSVSGIPSRPHEGGEWPKFSMLATQDSPGGKRDGGLFCGAPGNSNTGKTGLIPRRALPGLVLQLPASIACSAASIP